MKSIQSITVTAVVLMFVLSAFAGTAAAAHDPKDPNHDALGDKAVVGDQPMVPEDQFLKAKKAFDEEVPDEKNFPGADWDGDEFSPSDNVAVTDSENMDGLAKKGVMPGDNVQDDVPGDNSQVPDTIFDKKIVPGGGVAYDAPPEDRFLKAKKAFDENENFPDGTFEENVPKTGLIGFGSFDENVPDTIFDGDDDEEFQDGSDPVLAP